MDYSSLGISRINPPNRQEAATSVLLFRSLLCVCLAGLNSAHDAYSTAFVARRQRTVASLAVPPANLERPSSIDISLINENRRCHIQRGTVHGSGRGISSQGAAVDISMHRCNRFLTTAGLPHDSASRRYIRCTELGSCENLVRNPFDGFGRVRTRDAEFAPSH